MWKISKKKEILGAAPGIWLVPGDQFDPGKDLHSDKQANLHVVSNVAYYADPDEPAGLLLSSELDRDLTPAGRCRPTWRASTVT